MKLTAGTFIRSDRETVWRYSQTPDLHSRWDLRFTDIEYLPRPSLGEPQRFRYATRIGFGLRVEGWGETVGTSVGGTSALGFGSEDPKSLILSGTGSWSYHEEDGGVRFSTVYDYYPRYGAVGRVLDFAFRPLMIWATRWSFDRLRIWIEEGTSPEFSLRLWLTKVVARSALGLVWLYEGLVPKIVAQSAEEIALVRESSLYLGAPGATLATLGAAECVFALWLLWGRFERLSAGLSAAGVLGLAALVTALSPSSLTDPLGGISKNLGLLACSLVVWVLSARTPLAARARPRGPSGGNRKDAER